jgi:hypothetical protein
MDKAQKLTGPEMMIRSVLRAMGVNPQEIVAMMTTVIGEMQGGLKATVETMQRLEIQQQENRKLLLHIMAELKIPMPEAGAHGSNGVLSGEILPPPNN